jgi:hypothetical protein
LELGISEDYTTVSMSIAGKELAKFKLDPVGVQEFRKDKSSIFWVITPCGPLEVNSACCLLHAVSLLA